MRKIPYFSDANILENLSKGSCAMTFLMGSGKKKFFRKYTEAQEVENLKAQMDWMKNNEEKIKVAKIIDYKLGNNFFYYDMQFYKNSKPLFDYINEEGAERGFLVIQNVLNDLLKSMYGPNLKKIDVKNLDRYVDEKVKKNIELIKSYPKINELLKYDTLTINGVEYKNLDYILKYITKDKLKEIFNNDTITNIHGDLTIENIIYMDNDYYLIDPNIINYHLSDNLDYSKLLQSLHGKYEYLQNIDKWNIVKNKVDYSISTQSRVYDDLLFLYDEYLNQNFSKGKVRSIYYHEIIHWIRMLVHKIKDGTSSFIIYFCQFIIISNDIISRFKEGE